MRLFTLTVCAAAVSALLAGCDDTSSVRLSKSVEAGDGGGVLKVIDTLQCPDTLGPLTRKGSAQAGGTVCTYGGPRGAEVSLHLVALEDGGADEAVQAFEDQLIAAMPDTAARMNGATADADDGRARADAARADAEARAGGDGGERTTVRMPGLSVDADSGADKATVRLPGITVDADGENARVRVGGMTIDADENSSDVTVSSEDDSVSVMARDDAAEIRTHSRGPSTRITYVLTDRTASDEGWRMVGYEARGPEGGPIVVATVRAKDRDDDSIFDAAKELVTLNVGE